MGLEVNSKGTLATTALVGIRRCGIINPEHRNNSVGLSVGACNPAASSADIRDVEADATSVLRHLGAIAEDLEDVSERVRDVRQEARSKVGMLHPSIKYSWRCVGELPERQRIVGGLHLGNITPPERDCDAEISVLRAFYDFAIYLGQIHPLHRLEAKVIKIKIARVIHDLLILTAESMNVLLEVFIKQMTHTLVCFNDRVTGLLL